MSCLKCGMPTTSKNIVCRDCQRFSATIIKFFDIVNEIFEKGEMLDPTSDKLLQALADSVFITAENPQIRIYYKLCEFFVESAIKGIESVDEVTLSRAVRTTKSLKDALDVFKELNLIKINLKGYDREVIFTQKLKNMATQHQISGGVSKQLILRLAHIYSGYILIYLLKKVALIASEDDLRRLPYNMRPKTLWTSLMFLWNLAYDGYRKFYEEEFDKFLGKRGIPISTRNKIKRALLNLDGKLIQGLIKEYNIRENGKVEYTTEDYILIEMERLRQVVEREREGI